MSNNTLGPGIFDLTGKVALVTGGSGIQGKRITKGLASFGANVAIVDINGDSAINLAKEIEAEFGNTTIGISCDVSNEQNVHEMVSKVKETFGGIHILHNNAASKSSNPEDFFKPFEEFSLKLWREIMAVNIDGMFLVAQAVGKIMIEQGKGSIIQTASTYGVVAPDQRIYNGSEYMGFKINTPAAYSTSKAAVIGLTRYLATYWADKGIRVNSLTPGGIESGQNNVFKENYASRTPLGRMGKVDEMVGAVIYLASDASSYVTGHNLIVDGGWTAW